MNRNLVVSLLFFGIYIFSAGSDARSADNYNGIYDYFLRRNIIYTKLDPQINMAFANLLRVAEPKLTLVVNSDQAADIRIIVLNTHDPAKASAAPVKRFEEVFDQVKGNMLAVSSSLIIIDKDFVSKLILNAWLDSMQAAFGFDEAVKTGGSDIRNLESIMASKYNPLGDFGRYRYLNRWRLGLIDPTYADDYSKVDVGLRSSLITGALAPVLLHELGHLRQGTTGNFSNVIGYIIDLIRIPRIRAAEDSADAYASEKVAAYLSSLSRSDYTFALIGVTATVKLLRDELIEEGFSGFRGLSASDFFAEVYSADCETAPAYVPPAELYDRPIVTALNSLYGADVESFIAPQSVLFAAVVGAGNFPLITKEEFAGLRARIVESQNASHGHRILRATGLVQAVRDAWKARLDSDTTRREDADRVFAEFTGAAGQLLSALVDDDDRKLAPSPSRLYVQGTIDKVEHDLPALNFSDAANCPSSTCRIGTFKDGSTGFVELHGDDSGIALIRTLLPVAFGDTSPSGQRAAEKYLEVMSKLLLTSFGEDESPDLSATQSLKSFVILRFFLTRVLQCGVVSGRVNDTDPVVGFRSVNPAGWIELRIEGAEAKK
ncbi:hypothetical protein HFO06_28705 [Rhizobium leguminosarum]|uniref:hypothetical protein n=1 Tax=Rhizobium leguminosarum TaxID=384 RepID=UPI001C98474F|nr:hypothetical protein [Rhizobium leguminosarum]MBY5767032.1 hypothetical protein [Rhizobium leguminosarum]